MLKVLQTEDMMTERAALLTTWEAIIPTLSSWSHDKDVEDRGRISDWKEELEKLKVEEREEHQAETK